jgi:hypothetical protein
MRPRHALVLFVLVALGASTVALAAATKSVTIAARPHAVVYGAATTLSGVALPAKENEKVSVLSQACAHGTLLPLAPSKPELTATTAATGAWSAAVSPTVTTGYAARARGMTSSPIRVGVRPQVSLAKLAAHRYQARVLAAQSFAGKKALFQRYRPARGSWSTLRRVLLKAVGTSTTTPSGTVSGRSFRSGVRAGVQVRLVLSQRQVGGCYLPGLSAVITS